MCFGMCGISVDISFGFGGLGQVRVAVCVFDVAKVWNTFGCDGLQGSSSAHKQLPCHRTSTDRWFGLKSTKVSLGLV